MTNSELLAQLNAFRADDGLPPLATWKTSRNGPQLDAYIAAGGKNIVPDTEGVTIHADSPMGQVVFAAVDATAPVEAPGVSNGVVVDPHVESLQKFADEVVGARPVEQPSDFEASADELAAQQGRPVNATESELDRLAKEQHGMSFNELVEKVIDGAVTVMPQPVKLPAGTTKKGQVLAMIQAGPSQVSHIATTLSISPTAVRSLIGDLQRAGYSFTVVRKGGEREGYYSVKVS